LIDLPPDVDLSKGWWKSETKETEEELKDRIKRIMDRLKEMAQKVDENYTILLISHGAFLNYFFSTLTQSECFLDSIYRF
jgi:broad specificity phosphatase PhoE